MIESSTEELLKAKLIGNSPKMQQLRMMIKFAGRCNSSIMVTGPSGSGKEVVAEAIHTISERNAGPNIAVNCGALPEQLIESELFGHEKGSFTGAVSRHVGLFEQSNSGTIFLDEIGDMPLNMQVKLLRVLESRIVNRVGGSHDIALDVRVIAATHKNLSAAIQSKRFREDLYYRLCVVPIEVPALEERKEDIPQLVEHFLRQHGEAQTRPIFTTEAYAALQCYNWPGNVRELRNVVERATVFFSSKKILARDIASLVQSDIAPIMGQDAANQSEFSDIMQSYAATPGTDANNYNPAEVSNHQASVNRSIDVQDLNAHLQSEERRIILHALTTSHGVVSRAARSINIKRTTLIDKMRKHNIDKSLKAGGVFQVAM